jgi:DNA-binding SARP family transcriptional activator
VWIAATDTTATTTAPLLAVRLFGQVELRSGPHRLPALDSARAESLLAYLLVHREAPVSRQRIAFALWPDSTEPQARTNLRHVLHNLRRALVDTDRYLEITPRALHWRPHGPYWLDIAAFDELMSRADRTTDDAEALGWLR